MLLVYEYDQRVKTASRTNTNEPSNYLTLSRMMTAANEVFFLPLLVHAAKELAIANLIFTVLQLTKLS